MSRDMAGTTTAGYFVALGTAVFFFLAGAGVANAADVTLGVGGDVRVQGINDATGNTMTVDLTGVPSEVRVTDTTSDPTSSDASCIDNGNNVVCTVTDQSINVTASKNHANSITVVGNIPLIYTGGDLTDTVQGGSGDDRFFTGDGTDTQKGGGGADQLFNEAGTDTFDGEGGGDVVDAVDFTGAPSPDNFSDTGSGGTDAIGYFSAATGVDLHIGDGLANDGENAGAESDTVGTGFETVSGGPQDDGIFGSSADESLLGQAGEDDISGGPGADTFVGGVGVDNLIATDGVVDHALDCGDGDGEIAAVDADDPEPINCETVQRSGAGTGGGGTGGGSGGGGSGGGGDGGGGGTAGALLPTPTAPVGSSLIRARMPNVVGKDVDEARDAIAKTFFGVSFELDFVKSCKATKNLEVVKQSPPGGKKANGTASDPVVATLDVCLGDDDFLNDCNTASLKDDLKPLAGKLDGGLAMEVAKRLADCKVDYDVKVSAAAEEAAKLAAQSAKKRKKGEIKVAMDCPAESDLITSVGEGFTQADKLTFGLRVNGDRNELWTLPTPRGGRGTASYKSFVSLTVKDKAGQWPEATAVVDDDSINPFNERTDLYRSRLGVITIPIEAVNPGTLRICVFQETSGPELLTKSIEIQVIEGPAGRSNEVYKTAGGRYIKFGDGPPSEISADAAGADARKAGLAAATQRDLFGCLADLWGCVSSLFNGRSQTVNNLDGDGSVSRPLKVSLATKKAQLGIAQIAMGPHLQAFPGQPVVAKRPCTVLYQNVYYLTECPVITAPDGAALVGANFGGGAGIVAAGGGNILSHNGGAIVAAGAGNLIGSDGATLIGSDGATLIGSDGATLIGSDGATLIGSDGATLVAAGGLTASNGIVAAGGLNAIQPDTAGIVAAGGLNLIGSDGATIVAAGAGNLIGSDGGSLVGNNGLG